MENYQWVTRLLRRGLLGGLLALLVGCSPAEQAEPTGESPLTAVDVSAAEPPVTLARDQETPMLAMWSNSCALCHVDGNAGAPRMGNISEWSPRLAKGSDVLLRHTLEGFNQMPPLGYCMACERDDFVAMIEFMTRGASAETTTPTGEAELEEVP